MHDVNQQPFPCSRPGAPAPHENKQKLNTHSTSPWKRSFSLVQTFLWFWPLGSVCIWLLIPGQICKQSVHKTEQGWLTRTRITFETLKKKNWLKKKSSSMYNSIEWPNYTYFSCTCSCLMIVWSNDDGTQCLMIKRQQFRLLLYPQVQFLLLTIKNINIRQKL